MKTTGFARLCRLTILIVPVLLTERANFADCSGVAAFADPYGVWVWPDRDPVAPGEVVTYTIEYLTWHRTEILDAQRTFQITLPRGLRFLSASDGGVLVEDTLEWYFEAINPSENGRRQFTALVDPGTAMGSSFELVVVIPEEPCWSSSAALRCTSHVQPKPPLEVSLDGPDLLHDFDLRAAYTVTIKNIGTETLENVPVTLFSQTDGWDLSDVLISGNGRLVDNSHELQATWVLDEPPPGASRSVGVGVKWVYIWFRDYQQVRTVAAATPPTGGSAVQATQVLWIDYYDPPQRSLRIDSITPHPLEASAKEIPLTIQGIGFDAATRAVFRSGRQRIEVPPEKLEEVDSTTLRAAVTFPPGYSLWTLHLVRPLWFASSEMAQFVFTVANPLQLAQPELLKTGPSFACRLRGGAGYPATIQSSPDLLRWQDVTNVTPQGESVFFMESRSTSGQRFYRALRKD